jgi:hypothetical protein
LLKDTLNEAKAGYNTHGGATAMDAAREENLRAREREAVQKRTQAAFS